MENQSLWGRGLSMKEITEQVPRAEKVAAASFVAPNSHQNVLWGRKMHVSGDQMFLILGDRLSM